MSSIYGSPNIFGRFKFSLDEELDMNCFVFSLVNKENEPCKITQKNLDFVIYASIFWPISCHRLSAESKQLYLQQQSQAKFFLAGSAEYQPTEIEDYRVE